MNFPHELTCQILTNQGIRIIDFNHFLLFYSFTYFIEYFNYFEKPEFEK